MKRFLSIFGAALLALLVTLTLCYLQLRPPPPLPLPPRGADLSSVVLIVPGQGRSAPVDLEVRGNQIAAVRPASGSDINGFVLPGLTNAHLHAPMLPFPGEEALYAFLHLYHGVTQGRMPAGDLDMRDAINDSVYPGPKLLSCGPFVDGDPPLWRSSLVATDVHSANAAVEQIATEGYDCIKVYNELTAEASEAVYLAAAGRGLPVIGHVPWRQDATEAWINDQQHLLGLPVATTENRAGQYARAMLRLAELDDARLTQLADAMNSAEVALTPTLITLQRKASLENYEALRNAPSATLLPHYYRQLLWHNKRGLVSSRRFSAADHAQFRAVYPTALRAIDTLYEAGVEIHSGTDSPAEFIVPGAGLLEELALLEEAGLSTEQVLEISAVTTARYLFGEAYGRLEPGAPADFVVYAEDPTQNLSLLDSRIAVVRDGRYYSRDVLEQQLTIYMNWYDSPLYRAVSESIVRAGLWLVNQAAG